MSTKVEDEKDLKEASKLFNNSFAALRSRRAGNPEAQAADWLNEARIEMMKEIEGSFYDLAKKADLNDPLQLPDWVVDPRVPLSIPTKRWPLALAPYKKQFREDFDSFMKDYGFNASVVDSGCFPHLDVHITFPEEILDNSVKREGAAIKSDALKSFSDIVSRITQDLRAPNATASTSKRRKRESEDDEDIKPDTEVKSELDDTQGSSTMSKRNKRTRVSATKAASGTSTSKTAKSVTSTSRRGRK